MSGALQRPLPVSGQGFQLGHADGPAGGGPLEEPQVTQPDAAGLLCRTRRRTRRRAPLSPRRQGFPDVGQGGPPVWRQGPGEPEERGPRRSVEMGPGDQSQQAHAAAAPLLDPPLDAPPVVPPERGPGHELRALGLQTVAGELAEPVNPGEDQVRAPRILLLGLESQSEGRPDRHLARTRLPALAVGGREELNRSSPIVAAEMERRPEHHPGRADPPPRRQHSPGQPVRPLERRIDAEAAGQQRQGEIVGFLAHQRHPNEPQRERYKGQVEGDVKAAAEPPSAP